ncbi:MAG: SEC-C domain-containing protein, partial [Acidimicrobiales bacterium]
VAICPDLLSLDWDEGPGLELAGGGRLTVELGPNRQGEDDSVLVGPDGWLDGFAPGDLLAFTRRDHSVHVEVVAPNGDGALEIGLLRHAVDGHIPPGHGDEALPVALDALAADPEAFRRPRPPLGELLEAAGLDRRGFSFGRAGEAWTSRPERYQRDQRARVAVEWGFGRCCQAAFDRVVSAYDGYQADSDTGLAGMDGIAGELGHSSVAPAFAGYALDVGNDTTEQLSAFADAVLAAAPAHQAAPPRYLVAAVAEHCGELQMAETTLRSVLADHPGYGPAAATLARYEIDRSDIRRAITLLHHPDLDEDNPTLDFLEELRDRIDAPYRSVGRNQPCPCGSGRKFKQCCQRDRRLSLADRTPLVTHKLVRFAADARRRSRLVGLASSASDPDDPNLISTLAELARDPIIVDFALWEGQLAEEYLEQRGALLPSDEAD